MSVKERIKQEREALKKKVFSFSTFVELLAEYINEPDFESHVMKMGKDEKGEAIAEEIKIYPVKHIRKLCKKVLLDFGVAAADAEKVMDKDYKFAKKDVEGLYEFMSDFLYQYLQTGRRLELFNKNDMNVSIIATEMEEKVKKFPKNKFKDEETFIKYKTHKKVTAKSSCPEWEKETLTPDQKSVLKSLRKVLK